MKKPFSKLTKQEIAKAWDENSCVKAILLTKELALFLSVSKKTIDEWVSQGFLAGTFRKRGKHRFFWRDRVLEQLFNGPEWERDKA